MWCNYELVTNSPKCQNLFYSFNNAKGAFLSFGKLFKWQNCNLGKPLGFRFGLGLGFGPF